MDMAVTDSALTRIPVADGKSGENVRLYLLDMSKADPEKLKEFRCGDSWTPYEETPEEQEHRLAEGRAALAEYEAEYGAFTLEEKAWARKILGDLGIGNDVSR